MKTIYLIACAKGKRQGPIAAKDLYDSPLFSKSRAHAQQRADEWYILSAKYHLLSPEQVIEDYDLTLNAMSKTEQSAWADVVLDALTKVTKPGDKLIFLAGENYRKNLEGRLLERGYEVEVPMRGLRIGHALQWLQIQASMPVNSVQKAS